MFKKFFVIFFFLCLLMNIAAIAFADVAINETNFPDSNFRSYVTSNFDTTSDGTLTNAEIAAVKIINVTNSNIQSLKGIENFTELVSLDCGGNPISSFDVSQNTKLQELYAAANHQLVTVNMSNNSELRVICFDDTSLTSVDTSHSPLIHNIGFSDADLQKLDVSQNTNLRWLTCNNSKLTSLDVSQNGELLELSCTNNQITSLNVTNATKLEKLYVASNRLTTIDLASNTALTTIECNTQNATANYYANDSGGSYPYELYLSDLGITDTSKLSSIQVTNSSGNTVNYNFTSSVAASSVAVAADDSIIMIFDDAPSTMTYNYATGYNSVNMNVIVTLSEGSSGGSSGTDSTSGITAISVTSPDTKIINIPYLGGSFSNVIVTVTGNMDNSTYGVEKGTLTDATITSSGTSSNTLIVSGTAPYNSSASPVSHTVTVNITDSNGTSHSDTFTVVVAASGTDTGTGTGTETGSDVVVINETNFPDATFRAYVSSNFDTDSSGGLSASEIAAVTRISVMNNGNITSLKGIEYFTALQSLDCGGNQLTTLDISKNTALTALVCWGNQLTNLDVSANTALTIIYCDGNRLTALDVSNNFSLGTLRCAENQLTALDVSNNVSLTELSYSQNQIKTLDLSQNSSLITLHYASQDVTISTGFSRTGDTFGITFSAFDLDATSFNERVSNIEAHDENGNLLTVTTDATGLDFNGIPSTMTYKYDTRVTSSSLTEPTNRYMDVYVTFLFTGTGTETETNTESNNNTNTNSRAWRYQFSMPSNLLSAIASKFGIDSSQIFQLSDSEILEESWTLDNSDSSAITNLGENVAINLPSVMPSNTGVYVMRYSIDSSLAGKNLKVRGISSNSSVSTSALENREYTFFDSNYNEITSVPSDGIVYAAINMTAGQTNRGVITTANELATGTVQALPEASRDNTLLSNIVNTWNENPNRDTSINIADLKFIESKDIYPPQEAPAVITEQARKENANLLGKLSTLSVDTDGYYVFHVILSDDLAKEVVSVDVGQLRFYHAIYESGDVLPSAVSTSDGKVRGSFLLGLLNTFELLTMSGEKMQFGAKEFLMVGFLNAGKPLSLYIAKLLLALLFGGCNTGVGVVSFVTLIGGFLFVKKIRSKKK